MSQTKKRMGKVQQIDFLLLRKAESIPSLTHKPVPADTKQAADYWFDRGRREAYLDARVMLRAEGLLGV